jgi:lipoprotein Spr/probable lipoprotein NlpC
MKSRAGFPILMLFILLALGGCASNQQLQTSASSNWEPPQNTTAESAAKADRLWQVFNRYEGTPYQYGGMSENGFDCSGFIATAFDEALGQQLPRTTSQLLAAGEAVEPEQIRAGDLVFFRIKGKDQHAGIYMGEDQFIHSSSSIGVTRSSLNAYYWRGRLSKIRRFD